MNKRTFRQNKKRKCRKCGHYCLWYCKEENKNYCPRCDSIVLVGIV